MVGDIGALNWFLVNEGRIEVEGGGEGTTWLVKLAGQIGQSNGISRQKGGG